MMAAEVHDKPADRHRQGRIGTHGDEEERGVLDVAVSVDVQEDSEAGDGDADGDDGEEEAMPEPVGEVGDEHSKGKSAGPGRDAAQLGLDVGVAVAFDDCGLRTIVSDCDSGLSVESSRSLTAKKAYPYAGTINPKYIKPPKKTLKSLNTFTMSLS